MKRLAVARLWHEGNSFSPVETGADEFRAREWVAGEAAARFYRGTATEMGAAVDFLDRRSDFEGRFLRCAAASPAGPLAAGLFADIRDDIVAGLGACAWDGVYLSLHGALLAAGVDSPDVALLRAVRDAIGDAPLAASFDFHANLDPAVIELVDVAVGYKTYPHTDMYDAGAKALRLLADTVAGRIAPVGALARTRLVLPSFNMRTGDGPMAEVAALARETEGRAPLLDVSAFGGFAYGDVAYGGACVMAFADGDRGAARDAAARIARALAERRSRFLVTLPTPEEGVRNALARAQGPVAVLDPADNPLSGGIGDTPALFRALLAARPRAPAVFAFFHDPELAATAHALGPGALLDCALGGRLSPLYGPPVEVSATILRVTDGRFVNRGPMETGLPVDLGPTAVLDVDGIAVIVTSRCRAPNDAAYFELHGIDLAATRLLCVKAKNHFRAAFGGMCRAIVEVDAAGPAGLDLARLPFRHAPGLARGAEGAIA
ncbi:MAG: M81 family metallopeptidase [Alphaproteobacteria bacterium]